jgi:hypothetical protein
MQKFIISQTAPTFMVKYNNKYIFKLLNKLSKRLNSSHYYKYITGTRFTLLEIFEMIMHLSMDTSFSFTMDEVQQRKQMARGLYNLLSKYI